MKQDDNRKQQDLLQRIEQKIFYLSCLKANIQKTRKMHQKHQKILADINTAASLFIPKPEHKETF
jgi:hypothetical protein